MNYRSLAKLVLRLFSLYLLFTFIASLQSFLISFFSMLQQFPAEYALGDKISMILKAYYPVGITWILFIALFVILWMRSDSLSARITADISIDQRVEEGSMSGEVLLSIGFIVCGMFILINSLPEMISLVVLFALKHTAYVNEEFVSQTSRIQSVHVASLVIKILISCALVLNPYKVAKKIAKMNSIR